jgi:GNAT superfamily N-acetyltransferase
MTGPYEIVPYGAMHKGQVAALQTHLWSGDLDLAMRYLEWKYEQNPYLPEPLIYLAFSGGELVGMRGFYGATWEAGSPPAGFLVPVADDLVVAPEHRNRGLVTLIMRAAFEDLASRGYQYVLNLSGTPVTVIGSLAMGWKSGGLLEPIMLRQGAERVREVLRDTRLLWRFAESPLLRSAGASPFQRLDRMAQRRLPRSVSVEQEPRLDAMSELVARLGHDGRIRHRRDREYFAWRLRNPLASYRFVYCGDDRLEGYLVLCAAHAPAAAAPRVKLVDLEASDPAVRAELLGAAIDLGRFPELFVWGACLPPDARTMLSARGFSPVGPDRAREAPRLLVKSVAQQPPECLWLLGDRTLTELTDWDLRMLYAMAS